MKNRCILIVIIGFVLAAAFLSCAKPALPPQTVFSDEAASETSVQAPPFPVFEQPATAPTAAGEEAKAYLQITGGADTLKAVYQALDAAAGDPEKELAALQNIEGIGGTSAPDAGTVAVLKQLRQLPAPCFSEDCKVTFRSLRYLPEGGSLSMVFRSEEDPALVLECSAVMQDGQLATSTGMYDGYPFLRTVQTGAGKLYLYTIPEDVSLSREWFGGILPVERNGYLLLLRKETDAAVDEALLERYRKAFDGLSIRSFGSIYCADPEA